ncbi:obscurin-like isoform X2 [Heterodontus francisci]|uniref:obscurin-like isoform X2 n=1 Tax=Heterodontus francisci TaxID=7792 RepID=UPI00355B8924
MTGRPGAALGVILQPGLNNHSERDRTICRKIFVLSNSAGMPPVAGFYAAKVFLTLSAVTLLFSPSDTLLMEIFQSPLQVLVNEDVLLRCKVSDFNTAELDLHYVAIQWFFIHEKSRRKVYVFNEGNHSSNRPGARMNEDDLRKGNASLYLPKIQINEEGQYTCTVFYTPAKAEKSSVVQVLAQPKISLSNERITIPNGSKGSVRCDVTGFYPQQLDIRWEKRSHGKTESVTSKDGGGELDSNDDGTFNKSSQIYIAATSEDDGNIYRCIVKHQSYPNATILEAQLIVTESKSTTSVGAIVGVLVVVVIAAFLAAGYYYFKNHQKVPPLKVSELTCSHDAEPGKEVTLLCTINTLFAEEVETEWYRGKVKIINGVNFGMVMEEGFSEGGLSNITAKATFIPVLDDNQVEYSIKVTHPRVSTIPVKRSLKLMLQVHVLPPSVSEITCSPDPKPGSRVTLSCCVHTYFPKEIEFEWYRGKETIEQSKGDKVIREESISNDGLSITAKLTFTPATDDDQIEYRIQVIHRRLSSTPIERMFQFNLQVLHPLVSEIAFTSNPQPNQKSTLHSTISMFFPKEIEVQWFRGEKIIKNSDKYGISMEELVSEQGLFKIAKLTLIPIPDDDQVIYRIKVAYPQIAMKPTERNFLLDLKGTPPIVPNIVCCSAPTEGEEVTLCSNICAYFPKDINVEWYRGEAILETNDKLGVTIEESIENTYFKFTELTFTASADDDQMEYRIKVTRISSNISPTERSFLLQF